MKHLCCFLSLVLVTLLVPLSGCRHATKGKPGGEGETPRVHVVKPAVNTLTFSITRPGHIEAFEQTPLFSKVEGYVGKTRQVAGKDGKPAKKAIADIGDEVKEGEVLAEILVPELVEEYEQEKALLTQAKAGVEQSAKAFFVSEKFAASAKAQIAEAEAGLMKAEGSYQFAKGEHKRISDLAISGSVTPQLVEEKLLQFKSAEAAKAEAKAKVESVKAAQAEAEAKVEKAQADQAAAEAHVLVATAKADKVKALLDYTQIRAPFDGVVTERNIDTGHYVRPPQGAAKPMFVVTRTDIMRVFVDVPEMEAALVEIGNAAVVKVQALKGKEIKGEVTRKTGALDSISRTLKTEIDLPNKDKKLLPGLYVMVKITLEERTKALTVPTKAVIQEGNKNFCCCVDADSKVVRKAVTVGLQAGDETEIIAGLTGEEKVVRDNAAALKDGQTVAVIAENG